MKKKVWALACHLGHLRRKNRDILVLTLKQRTFYTSIEIWALFLVQSLIAKKHSTSSSSNDKVTHNAWHVISIVSLQILCLASRSKITENVDENSHDLTCLHSVDIFLLFGLIEDPLHDSRGRVGVPGGHGGVGDAVLQKAHFEFDSLSFGSGILRRVSSSGMFTVRPLSHEWLRYECIATQFDLLRSLEDTQSARISEMTLLSLFSENEFGAVSLWVIWCLADAHSFSRRSAKRDMSIKLDTIIWDYLRQIKTGL